MAIASEAEEEDIPVKTKDVYLEPITLDDAILQMELSGHNFYAYLDEESGEVCVVYRRYDGGYGVIETHTNH
jgi:putative sigma-54 modulation protein